MRQTKVEGTIEGRAFVYGRNIDTDQIYPGRFLELTEERDMARHAMEGADPYFIREFSRGDLIVASTNFGCGSSREHAAITLKAIGVGAVLAKSFGRIFYRNAVNLGLPVLVCPGVGASVEPQDVLSVDLESGTVLNRTSGVLLQAQPLSDYPMEILRHGGIKALLRRTLKHSEKDSL